jgi:hypothetical protein
MSYNRGRLRDQRKFILSISESFALVPPRFFSNPERSTVLSLPALPSLVFLGLAISLMLPSASPAQTGPQEPEIKVFDLASAPDFQNYGQVLKTYAHKHNPRSDNDFCVVGYLTADGLKSAWVIWPQKRKIILWEGQNDLDLSRRTLDLKSDVVPTENDLHGSTYLVTKTWVTQITDACKRLGTQVHIPRK